MRLFIAIPLPTDVRRTAAAAQAALVAHGAKGRFVPSENFHITLHFIGESEALTEAVAAMHLAARDIRPFVLRLGGYGGFGGKKGKTAFLSVSCDSGELDRLYESLESALWEQGFAGNRGRLSPHVTLGRNVQRDEGFAAPAANAAFTAGSIVLYESRAVPGRMQYLPLHTEKLT